MGPGGRPPAAPGPTSGPRMPAGKRDEAPEPAPADPTGEPGCGLFVLGAMLGSLDGLLFGGLLCPNVGTWGEGLLGWLCGGATLGAAAGALFVGVVGRMLRPGKD